MIKHLKSKKGFTLIEMIIGIMVFSIISGVVAATFVQMVRVTEEVTDLGQLEMIANEASAELLNDLRIAKDVVITGNPADDDHTISIDTDSYTAYYTIDATVNILMRKWDPDVAEPYLPVLARDFYMGNVLDMTFSSTGDVADEDYTVSVTVSIAEDVGEPAIFTETYMIRPSYMNQS